MSHQQTHDKGLGICIGSRLQEQCSPKPGSSYVQGSEYSYKETDKIESIPTCFGHYLPVLLHHSLDSLSLASCGSGVLSLLLFIIIT